LPDDAGRNALVSIEKRGDVTVAVFRQVPVVVVDEGGKGRLDQAGVPSLRSLARMLMLDTGLQAVVVVRPETMDAGEDVAQVKAATLVHRLNELARDADAAVVGQTSDLTGVRGYEQAGLGVLLRRRDDSTK
jgi:hypothetical protein